MVRDMPDEAVDIVRKIDNVEAAQWRCREDAAAARVVASGQAAVGCWGFDSSMFQEPYESVLRYAWRRVGPTDAPDVAAETFEIAWEKYDRFPRDRPLPWLYVTARNLTLNLTRKGERRDGLTDSPSEDATRHGAEDDHAAAITARQAALAALNGLSDEDREPVLLVCWEGLDLRQAATIVGCSRQAAAMPPAPRT
jgi:RNA polymerase sigma-70 factor (ECF subfamily)